MLYMSQGKPSFVSEMKVEEVVDFMMSLGSKDWPTQIKWDRKDGKKVLKIWVEYIDWNPQKRDYVDASKVYTVPYSRNHMRLHSFHSPSPDRHGEKWYNTLSEDRIILRTELRTELKYWMDKIGLI